MTAYEFILALNGVQWLGIIVLAYIAMWTVVGACAAFANAIRKK
jgi:hypothetical protein